MTNLKVYIRRQDKMIIILDSNDLETVSLCETYDKYGQKVDCEYAYCDETGHMECEAYTFWNGSNFESVVTRCEIDEAIDLDELESKESEKILSEYESIKNKLNYIERLYKPVEEVLL
jgi:hypothetical protein